VDTNALAANAAASRANMLGRRMVLANRHRTAINMVDKTIATPKALADSPNPPGL
jgi:hypothetical protein